MQFVVVDVGDDTAQGTQLLRVLFAELVGLIRAVLGFAGMLIGCCRVLIRGTGAFLRRADTALRFLVNLLHLVASVFDLLTVTAGLFTYLIHLRLNG